MTTINPNSVSNKNFKQVESDSWTSLYLPAICAAILMGGVLFLAISCSKKSDNVAKISPPSQSAVSAPLPSPPLASLPEKPKKAVKKHRSANATYVNSEYGVSFSYPRRYSFQSGDKLAPMATSYLKSGSRMVAAVNMPGNSYPDTDFTAALLKVSVDKDMTSDECMQFAPSAEGAGEVKPTTVKLGENEYSVFEQINGEDNKKSDLKFFHLFKNAACYEFAAALDTTEKPEDMAQVDRGKIFEQLEKILTTAKIKDLQATEVESAGSTRATGSPIADSKTSEPNPSAAESNTANVKAAETTEKAQAVTPGQK
ncbi:MAG TPA: hypothetical protein VN708_19980 [Terriglobales bacterium]|jgi:hypothetical protein|nr:hypothetical protein [Terriglobales bacterium]